MNAQTLAAVTAAIVVLQYVLGVVVLPRLDPNGGAAKALNMLLGLLPFALKHMAPSVPAAMAARKPSTKTVPPGVTGMFMSALAIIGLVFAVVLVACTGAQVKTIAPVLDKFACVVAQDELGAKDPAIIAELCAIPLQDVLDMLAKQKAARAMARGDGGSK